MSLVRGVDIICCRAAFQPIHILNKFSQEQITIYSGTPTAFYYICKELLKRKWDIGLRFCNIGGELLSQEVLKIIHKALPETEFIHSYGLTETCSRATWIELSDVQDASCVGKPLQSFQFKVVDMDGKEAAVGQVGEIYFQGCNIMKGYYNDKERTERVFDNGWLKTKDMGWVDERGLLHIKGRRDDMIIRGGVNVYPLEIEQVLLRHNAVKDVKVYGEWENNVTMKICADVILEDKMSCGKREFIDYCRDRLPTHMVPDRLNYVERFQMNQNGKRLIKGNTLG